VVLHPSLWVIEQAYERIEEWLRPMGLELSVSKTRITHTHLWRNKVKPGFQFLGFHIIQPSVGRFKRGRMGLPFKTIIRPTRDNQIRHLRELREILKKHTKTEAIVVKCNPIIRGWANYYKSAASKSSFSKCDRIMMRQIMNWAYRKHPRRSKNWCCEAAHKYLRRFGFYKTSGKPCLQQFMYIRAHDEVKIQRHVKVGGSCSPFDGDWMYWTRRAPAGRALQVQ